MVSWLVVFLFTKKGLLDEISYINIAVFKCLRTMNLFFSFLLLTLISLPINECDGVKCDRKATRIVTTPRTTSSSSWDYPIHRVKTSRYKDYIPLETYRSKFGSLIGTQYDKWRPEGQILITDGKVVSISRDGSQHILRNSSGLSIYSTLTESGSGESPKIVIPARSYSSRRPAGAKGVGFGQTYWQWSEHGKVKAQQ